VDFDVIRIGEIVKVLPHTNQYAVSLRYTLHWSAAEFKRYAFG